MEVEGGGDLAVGAGQNLGQLGDEHPLGPLVVTAVAGHQVAVQEDAALIVERNDFQARGEGAEGEQRQGGGHEESISELTIINNNYLTDYKR